MEMSQTGWRGVRLDVEELDGWRGVERSWMDGEELDGWSGVRLAGEESDWMERSWMDGNESDSHSVIVWMKISVMCEWKRDRLTLSNPSVCLSVGRSVGRL